MKPYHIEVVHEGDEWTAQVLELPGCAASAATWAELEGLIDAAVKEWTEMAAEDGFTIPEPVKVERHEVQDETILAAGPLRAAREYYGDGVGISIWYPFDYNEAAGACFDLSAKDRPSLIALLLDV